MSKPLRAEPEASAELEDAITWYESQRTGLGSELLDSADSALERIARWPNAGAPVPDVPRKFPARRVPMERFPYHVIYLVTPTDIRILAFAHDSRRPGYWHARTFE